MKKVLIIGDYFYPDVASTGQLLTELCMDLQENFNISVLTSAPSKNSDYYKEAINYEKLENIDLIRIKTKPFNKCSKISRIFHIMEYFFLNRKAIKNLEKQDIIFSISQPPILGGLLGLFAKKRSRAKFVYNIQDFNPEQAESIGYLKIPILLWILKKIDIRTCRKADSILIVGNDMKETLKKRGISVDSKVVVINNWVNEKKIYPLNNERVSKFKDDYNLEGKLVFMYSGNIGLYYDLVRIVETLGRFSDRCEVVFAFVGDGAIKKDIEKWVHENNINNIVFIPYQNKEDLLYSLNAADIHFVTNSKGIKGVSVPSKIYGAMAVGKYIFGVLEEGSEAANLIKESACGIVVEPGDYEGIYNEIDRLIGRNTSEIERVGINGRRYIEEKLCKEFSIGKYRELFENIS